MMVFAGDRQRRLDSELLREILQQEFTNHRFNNSYVELCDQVAYCIAALLIDKLLILSSATDVALFVNEALFLEFLLINYLLDDALC